MSCPWPRSSPAQGPEGVPCRKALGRRELPGPRTCLTLQRGPCPGTGPCQVSLPEPGPLESTEASAVTAPQVKFPPCRPAPLLPHRTRSQDTPPRPTAFPPVDSSSGFLPGSRPNAGSTPHPGPQPLRSLKMAASCTPLLTLTSWGRQGGGGASSPSTLNLEAWTHRVSTVLTPG